MVTLLICIGLLVAGYFIYGNITAKIFGASNKIDTPAIRIKDGVDFVVIPRWKIFMIQFLNIAGLGPIFGAILGAMFGPACYIWIVFGCIFLGAVHDYYSGMLSVRHNGASLPEMVGEYLGIKPRVFLRFFTLILLILVGVAFVSGPAGLLSDMTGNITIFGHEYKTLFFWSAIIFLYYIFATLLPIDKIIGRIYPVFGAFLIFMATGILSVMLIHYFTGRLQMVELSMHNLKNWHSNPEANFLFPMMFVIISCGAISGFHATQSPLMARCLKNESDGKQIFYGAMIAEGIVTLIWATAAINYFGGPDQLNQVLAIHNPAWVVNEICQSWLGKTGAIIAIIGVIACPVTTGDTAFRSARLTIADMLHYSQAKLSKRLVIVVPLFLIAFIISGIKFETIWKYVGLSNQMLAMVVLWTASVYLARKHKFHWHLSLPATFITIICITYFFVSPHSTGGLEIGLLWGCLSGILAGLISLTIFIQYNRRIKIKHN